MGLVRRKTLRRAGGFDENGPKCPVCGGRQFEPCRSTAQKVDAVIFLPALFFQRKQDVKCVTCGKRFRRG